MPEPTKEKTPLVSDDPFISRMFADIGLVVKDGAIENAPPAPEPATSAAPKTQDTQAIPTLGEHARDLAARAKDKEDAAKTGEEAPKEEEAKKEGEAEDKKELNQPKEKEEAVAPDPKPEPKEEEKTPKVKVERTRPIEDIIESAVKRSMEAAKDSEAKQTPKEDPKVEEKKDPDADYISGLDEDRKYDLEVIRFAAVANPDKYKDAPSKLLAFYKKVDGFIAEKQKEDPKWDGSDDSEYADFLRANNPSLPKSEMRRIEREMIAKDAEARVEQKYQPKFEEADRRVRAQELKPEIDQATEGFRADVMRKMAESTDPALAPVAAVVKTKGFTNDAWKEAEAADKMVAKQVQFFTARAVELGREYLELATGVKPQARFDPALPPTAEPNKVAQKQATLFAFIDRQEQVLTGAPASIKTKDGKTFVTRREYSGMNDQQRARHWTLGHDDVLDMLALVAREQAEMTVKSRLKELEEEGFVRQPKKTEPKKEDKVEEKPVRNVSPKATTTQSPGPGVVDKGSGSKGLMTDAEKNALLSTGEKRWAS